MNLKKHSVASKCCVNCTHRIGAFGLVSLSPSFDSDISPAGHQQSVCALTFGILEMIYFAEGWLQSSFSGCKMESNTMPITRVHSMPFLKFTNLVLSSRWSSDLLFSATFKERYLPTKIPTKVYKQLNRYSNCIGSGEMHSVWNFREGKKSFLATWQM